VNDFVEIGGKQWQVLSDVLEYGRITLKLEGITIKDLEGIDWGNTNETIKLAKFSQCTIDSLRGLHNLKILTELNIRNCIINGNLDIEKCVNLYQIKISDCTITSEASLKLDNPKLGNLQINRTKGLTNLKFLGELPSINYLQVRNSSITQINNLEKITTLKRILLEKNQITKLDGLEQIINQNPQLISITLQYNPLKEAKEIEGIVKWEETGSRIYPRILNRTIGLLLPSVKVPPKPKPKPAHESYKVSDKATICGYCRGAIPPLGDYYVEHAKRANYLYSSGVSVDEKCFGRQDSITSTLYRQHYYYKQLILPVFSIPKLYGPVCEKCSDKFMQEAKGIRSKLKTKVFKSQIIKSRDSVQKKYKKMSKMWTKKV